MNKIKLPAVTPYGRPIPDQFVLERTATKVEAGDECIRPGGCPGTIRPIGELIEYPRKGHENWLMCDKCNARYTPEGIWADAGYYGYRITWRDAE